MLERVIHGLEKIVGSLSREDSNYEERNSAGTAKKPCSFVRRFSGIFRTAKTLPDWPQSWNISKRPCGSAFLS